MKHNQNNPSFKFFVEPDEFNKYSDRQFLQYCLGATLYMPGTQIVLDKILNKNLSGLTSMVMCFEDALREEYLPDAEHNVLKHLQGIYDEVNSSKIAIDDIPLIFLRVRNLNQFQEFAAHLTPEISSVLTGFVFPKFTADNGREYFDYLEHLNQKLGVLLYGMPILEGKEIAFKETRLAELDKLTRLFQDYPEVILNLRVGGTDISSLFGLRRVLDNSIYDLLTVRDVLSDVLNVFSRMEVGYIISGPVWEYFSGCEEDDLQQVVEQGNVYRSLMSRAPVINPAVDGLLREIMLDKANGFVGKTIIHPSHASFVNAMQAVTREAYEDAVQIKAAPGGIVKSPQANKMNEVNPHRNWARTILNRARAYGVIESEADYWRLIFE